MIFTIATRLILPVLFCEVKYIYIYVCLFERPLKVRKNGTLFFERTSFERRSFKKENYHCFSLVKASQISKHIFCHIYGFMGSWWTLIQLTYCIPQTWKAISLFQLQWSCNKELSNLVIYFKTGSKWRKTSLTYFIEYGRDLPQSQQESIFRRALQYWADVSALSFSRTYSPQGAAIKIRYGMNYICLMFLIMGRTIRSDGSDRLIIIFFALCLW